MASFNLKLSDPTDILTPDTGRVAVFSNSAAAGLPYYKDDTGATFPLGTTGPAGVDGSTILHGSGVPSDASGNDGDMYVDEDTGDLYFKSGGTWGSPVTSLIGPTGPAGADGADGADGTNGTDGADGADGATGPAGPTGPTGATGSNGTPGSQIYNGSGAPSGGLGVNGDFYLNNTNGDYYQKASGSWVLTGNLTGPIGPTGATGPAGAAGAPGTSAIDSGTSLLSGGGVAFLQNFDFRVSAATYQIQGTAYSSPQTDVTLAAPDSTFSRFDAIVVNSSSAVAVITGTASANPEFPDVDPLTQLAVSYVLVRVGASAPTGTANITIYKENVEWTATATGGTINVASTSNPFAGTKDVEATTAISGNRVDFVTGSAVTMSGMKQLVFQLRSKATWPNQKSLRFTWFSGSTKVGQLVAVSHGTFGFHSDVTTGYQQVIIPISAFSIPTGLTANSLRVEVNGGSTAIGWYLDDVVLEATAVDVTPPNVFPASATASGTVKTDKTVADPMVYLKETVDTLLAAMGTSTGVEGKLSLFNNPQGLF